MLVVWVYIFVVAYMIEVKQVYADYRNSYKCHLNEKYIHYRFICPLFESTKLVRRGSRVQLYLQRLRIEKGYEVEEEFQFKYMSMKIHNSNKEQMILIGKFNMIPWQFVQYKQPLHTPTLCWRKQMTAAAGWIWRVGHVYLEMH